MYQIHTFYNDRCDIQFFAYADYNDALTYAKEQAAIYGAAFINQPDRYGRPQLQAVVTADGAVKRCFCCA